MRSQKAEAAAASTAPKIEVQIWPFPISTAADRLCAAAALAEGIEDGWTIQFCVMDAHSSSLVYTVVRAERVEPTTPIGMRVS
jgi:hypothetical protein